MKSLLLILILFSIRFLETASDDGAKSSADRDGNTMPSTNIHWKQSSNLAEDSKVKSRYSPHSELPANLENG
ncbi:hypothetical protein WA026_018203 [Henosepilachna vigintioctopunctata]|uniref:Uncharacterized protein n=1 Tax=Henosepilachna vigintioctopunctata TaxID=420089 RepID=A0AAW1VF31_9CUCU